MRRFAAAAVVVAALTALAPAPASADDRPAVVTVTWLAKAVAIGGGDLAIGYCEATADPGTTGHPVAFTSIVCGVDGAYELPDVLLGTRVPKTFPGSKAATVVMNASARPHQICYSATATFNGPNGPYDVTLPLECAPFNGI